MRLNLYPLFLSVGLQAALATNPYLDARVCAQCHREIDASYRATGMGRSLYRPSPANTIEDDSKRHGFLHALSGTHFSRIAMDGDYYQRRWQTGLDGQETNVEEMKIDAVIGSGNHARSYLYRTPSGAYIELPLGWYAEKGGYWAIRPDFNTHPPTRRFISYQCVLP